jgi:hypothetical protein
VKSSNHGSSRRPSPATRPRDRPSSRSTATPTQHLPTGAWVNGANTNYTHKKVSGVAAVAKDQTATFWVYSRDDGESTLTIDTSGGGKAVTDIGGTPGNANTLTFAVTAPKKGTYALTVRYSNPEQ